MLVSPCRGVIEPSEVAGLRPLLVPLRKIHSTPIGGISALTADTMACWEEEIAYWLEVRAHEQRREIARKLGVPTWVVEVC